MIEVIQDYFSCLRNFNFGKIFIFKTFFPLQFFVIASVLAVGTCIPTIIGGGKLFM